VAENDERMRKKRDGYTIGERIQEELKAVQNKNACNLITDAFYKTEIESGINFYVRRADFLKKEYSNNEFSKSVGFGRLHDIPDEAFNR